MASRLLTWAFIWNLHSCGFSFCDNVVKVCTSATPFVGRLQWKCGCLHRPTRRHRRWHLRLQYQQLGVDNVAPTILYHCRTVVGASYCWNLTWIQNTSTSNVQYQIIYKPPNSHTQSLSLTFEALLRSFGADMWAANVLVLCCGLVALFHHSASIRNIFKTWFLIKASSLSMLYGVFLTRALLKRALNERGVLISDFGVTIWQYAMAILGQGRVPERISDWLSLLHVP